MRQKSLNVKSSKCDGDLGTQFLHAKKLHVQAKFLSPMPVIYLMFWMLRHLFGDIHDIGMRFFYFDALFFRLLSNNCKILHDFLQTGKEIVELNPSLQ